MGDYNKDNVSPRPWHPQPDISSQVVDAIGEAVIYYVPYEGGGCQEEDNVYHIVHCVNMHDELVEKAKLYDEQESHCIHCGEYDPGIDHWRKCKKHPANIIIDELVKALEDVLAVCVGEYGYSENQALEVLDRAKGETDDESTESTRDETPAARP